MSGKTTSPFNERLIRIIKIQAEIARLGADLGKVMDLVCLRTQVMAHAEGAAVELAEGDEMVYRSASGKFESHLGIRLRRPKSLSGLCLEVSRPLRCDDTETDTRVDRESCIRLGIRSMIVVPLRHGETSVGVLKVMSGTPGAFDDSEVELLGLMSDLIGSAMYHAAKHETSRLVYEATHDALTGLANRSLFYERLREQLERARRENMAFSILNLDMDGLKPINDLMGHRAGDAALKEFAERLQKAAGRSDTVARVGGDEFALIIPGITDSNEAIEQKSLVLGASIGSAVYPHDGDKVDTLVETADKAMYEVKRTRKTHR